MDTTNKNFVPINIKMPPIGIEIELKDYFNDNIYTNTLLKVEWIEQKVVYTWEKKSHHYDVWRYI